MTDVEYPNPLAPGRVVGRLAAAFTAGGVRGVWFGALGATCHRRLLVFERRLDSPASPACTPRSARIALLDDARSYRLLRPDQPAALFDARRAAGASCFAAMVGECVVGATWARAGGARCEYLECDVRLRDDEVYLFDTMVDPAWRGRRIAPAIAIEQIRAFRAMGLARIVAAVLPENRASRRARARSGFVESGRIGWVGIGRWRRYFVRGGDVALAGVQP